MEAEGSNHWQYGERCEAAEVPAWPVHGCLLVSEGINFPRWGGKNLREPREMLGGSSTETLQDQGTCEEEEEEEGVSCL